MTSRVARAVAVGPVIDRVGARRAAMLVCGVAYFVVTMLPAVDPRWRAMDRRPERALTPAPA